MKASTIVRTLQLIRRQVELCSIPSVTKVSRKKDPYLVLISCILSLRTKDKTTYDAAERLFKVADNPKKMRMLSAALIEKLIYPVGFYRTKARVILGISKKIISEFSRQVPRTREQLLQFKGVGLKTANLVLGLGYAIPAICVDTHVHRISNRLGWVKTKTPEKTESALMRIIPKKYWIGLNAILVTFGQNLCEPISPFCSKCAVSSLCSRIGVHRSR